MNRILIYAASLFLSFSALAQNKTITAALTYGTPSLVLTGGKYEILGVLFQNSVATNTVLKFYDAGTASTSIVRQACTSWNSYATNFSSVWTNTAGILITNVFAGTYRYSTSEAAVTNERPKILGPLAAPASAVLTVDWLAFSPNLGLVALSDTASGTLQITYRETNP